MITFKTLSRTFLITVYVVVALFQTGIPIFAGDCSECDNPLVEIKNCDFEGDIPEFDEYGGWKEAKEGDVDVGSQMARGIEIFGRLKQNNPCADVYYIVNPPDRAPYRVGAKGDAKFEVRSTATIHKCVNGETTVVRHVVDKQIPLDPPQMSPQGNLISFTVENILDEFQLVPVNSQVFVKHELVALKNGVVYDKGDDLLDWVDPSPEEGGNYFYDEDASVESGGYTILPNDGLIVGPTSPMTFASLTIHFDKGDIGETIRKKETPASCSVDVDDQDEFPPYYKLKISDITNKFNETMPDNVKVALKVEKGKIHKGGEKLDDWYVFKTTGGKITDKILYLPPQCEEAQEDKISFAQVCDYHDGPESVGKTQFSRKIPNKQCFDATLTITGTLEISKRESHDSTSWDEYDEYRTYDELINASVTMSLKMTNSVDMFMFDEYWEYYKPVTRNISSFSAITNDIRYEYGMTKGGHGFETDHRFIGIGTGSRFATPALADIIIIAYDKKTKKAKRIVTTGAAIAYKHSVQEDLHTKKFSPEKGVATHSESNNKMSDKQFKLGPVQEPVAVSGGAGEAPPDLFVTNGDGIKSFGGYGTITIDTSGDDCYWYDECRETKTFRWSFSKSKKK